MLDTLLTLAQNTARYNSGVRWFQWGLTGVGVALLIGAAGAFFVKAKPGTSPLTVRIQKILGVLLAVLGIGLIAYAWIAYSTV